jgi:hypothetical protein
MTLLIVGVIGGVLAVILWLLIPKPTTEQPRPTPDENKPTPEARPRFQGNIRHYLHGSCRLEGKQVPYALFYITVRNTGSPSIVEGWPLEVSAGGATRTAHPALLREKFSLPESDYTPETDITPAQLAYLTSARLVETGGQVEGWLLYLLGQMANIDLGDAGTKLTVHFRDYTGADYTASPSAEKPPPGKWYLSGTDLSVPTQAKTPSKKRAGRRRK